MKTMFLAAAAVLALGVGAVNAQGVGATATSPGYGQKWAEMQRADQLSAANARTATPEKAAREVPFWNFWSKRGS
jgi:hypothetical protein